MTAIARVRRRSGTAALRIAARVTGARSDRTDKLILLIQPDHLGDVLLSQPAVRRVRRAFPDHRLVAVVGPWSRQIAELAWPVDEVRTFSFPAFDRAPGHDPTRSVRALPSASRTLAACRAEIALVLRPDDRWSAAAAQGAGIPVIVTGDDPEAARFADRTALTSEFAHRSAKALAIAAAAADEPFHAGVNWSTDPLVLDSFAGPVTRQLETIQSWSGDRPYAVIHPGSGAPVKHWLPHRWRAVAAELERRGFHVLLTGSAGEAGLCAEIAASTCSRSLAGKTDLEQLGSLLARATVVAGTDNGPMHLAVATGTPTVTLFGPSDPREFGPWGDPRRHRVAHAGWSCPRCRDLSLTRPEGCGCMLAISVEDVLRAIDEVMA